MTETTTVQVAHVDAKSQRIKAALEIKLSKGPAQPKALMLIIGDEYHAHQKEYSDMRVKWSSSKVTKSTFDALIKKGLLQLGMLQTQLSFTDIGRELAIFLLIEPARKEMEYDFEARAEEAKRKSLQWVMKAKIMKAYKLEEWEVTVHLYRQRRVDSYDYSIGFYQIRGENSDGALRYDDLVSIHKNYTDEYEVSTSGTHLSSTQAKRMAELMLIACQIIESGLLEGKEVSKADTPEAQIEEAIAYGWAHPVGYTDIEMGRRLTAVKHLRSISELGIPEANNAIRERVNSGIDIPNCNCEICKAK